MKIVTIRFMGGKEQTFKDPIRATDTEMSGLTGALVFEVVEKGSVAPLTHYFPFQNIAEITITTHPDE
jgi:hypothetical protein